MDFFSVMLMLSSAAFIGSNIGQQTKQTPFSLLPSLIAFPFMAEGTIGAFYIGPKLICQVAREQKLESRTGKET